MAEFSTSLVLHIAACGLSQNYSCYLFTSRFSENVGSVISTNSWPAKLNMVHLSWPSSCRIIRVHKVSTFELQPINGSEHHLSGDEEKDVLDDVSQPSVFPENWLQDLEERDEKYLSWPLLKLSRNDKASSAMKSPSAVPENGLQDLEERDEKNLSWCLLKLSRNDKVRSEMKLLSVVPENGLQDLEERDGKNLSWHRSTVCRKDKVRSEMKLLSVVPANGLQNLEEMDEKNLSRRLLNLSRNDKVRSAMKLFASMEFIGLRPDSHACNSLLSCLLRKERLDDALKVFQYMKASDRTTEHSYTLILQVTAKARGSEAAFEMFEELVGDVNQTKRFDVVLYNMMIALSHKEKDWLRSERIWRKMKENGHVGNSMTYHLLVTIFLAFRQYELAIEAYHEMVRSRVQPDASTMDAVIIAFVKDGKWEFALSVFHEMMNRKEKPNAITCNAVIHSLGNNGQTKLAFKVYDCMKSLGHVPCARTWNALLVSLCRGKHYLDALRLFERVRLKNPTVLELHLYNTALKACERIGYWERALQILWEMEDSGLSTPVTSYNLVIGACEVADEPKVALQVYHHMVHQKKTPNTFTLLSLIRACIRGSFWDEVHEILSLVPPSAHLYNAAIQGLCIRRQIRAATKLYLKMRKLDLTPDGKTRAMMLQYLPKSDIWWFRRRDENGCLQGGSKNDVLFRTKVLLKGRGHDINRKKGKIFY